MTAVDEQLSKRARRRLAILDKSEILFLSKGYSGVTLEMIIKETGGSRRGIYENFGGKKELFEAVCKRIFEQVHKELEMVETTDAAPREALTRLGKRLLIVLTSHPTLPLFELILAECRRFPAIGELFYQAVPCKAYMVLSDYLERQVLIGNLRPMDTAVGARQFYGMVREGIHLRCILNPGYRPSESEIDEAVVCAVNTFLGALSLEC